MKKFIWLLFIFFCFNLSVVFGDDLTCDPSPEEATLFKLKINGVETKSLPTKAYRIWYNLDHLDIGRYEIQGQFGKESTVEPSKTLWSEWAPKPVPFVYIKDEKLSSPSGFVIPMDGG